jgi:hypothetical protein
MLYAGMRLGFRTQDSSVRFRLEGLYYFYLIFITMERLGNIYNEVISEKKQFIGQCDKLRHNETNEIYWQEMMNNKKKISFKSFTSNVNFQPVLDEDEDINQYIKDSVRADSTTASYISNWGEREAMFFQTAGFEFIFI